MRLLNESISKYLGMQIWSSRMKSGLDIRIRELYVGREGEGSVGIRNV